MENRIVTIMINFVIRAIVGMGLIFFINQYMVSGSNPVEVGLNAVSFLTTGTLGIPGVCLLYGILYYQDM